MSRQGAVIHLLDTMRGIAQTALMQGYEANQNNMIRLDGCRIALTRLLGTEQATQLMIRMLDGNISLTYLAAVDYSI